MKLHLTLVTPDRDTHMQAEPAVLYSLAYGAMKRVVSGGVTGSNEDQQLARLVKVAVKGVLIMWGDKILDAMFRTRDHPRPGKGDDVVEWYTNVFTQIAIVQMCQSQITMVGKENDGIIEITGIHTRSNATLPEVGASSHQGANAGTAAIGDGRKEATQ